MLNPYFSVGDTVKVRRWSREKREFIVEEGEITKQLPKTREYVVKRDGVEYVYHDIHVLPKNYIH